MSKLQVYAEVFSAVEVNSTFYRIPRISTCERWRKEVDEVNEEFEFTVKGNREITHVDRFSSDKSLEVFEKMKEICEALDSRILLLQMPPSFRATEKSLENLRRFLQRTGRDSPRIAVEFRHESWKDEILEELIEEFSLIHCVDPFLRDPLGDSPAYFRLHGSPPGERMYRYKYTDEDLMVLKNKVMRYRDAYIFFNNIFMYEDAMRFSRVVEGEWE
ncbi:MAG: DUF72 domain-containing protein [Archaeoglobi archaeon]|nr:DUF72 domain-containing protein [Candidatus Mnemosynella bozhongmuii]